MPNNGTCVDCDKEVELTQVGTCSNCNSSSIVKRGAIKELETRIGEKEIERLNALVTHLTKGLEKIRDEEGKVCIDFDTCKHTACRSSYGAWHLANVTLETMNE